MSVREKFAADLRAANVTLPLSFSPECPASIIDADGRSFATIDMNRDRPDAEAIKIALWTMLAVNAAGGHVVAPPLFLTAGTSAPTTSGGQDNG